MNTINAASLSSFVPQANVPADPATGPTATAAATEAQSPITSVDQVDLSIEFDAATPRPQVQPVVNPTAWSPAMWWLLNRYEYLFTGLLPEQPARTIVIDEDQNQPGSISELGRPHWGESNLINPPPSAATLPEPEAADPPVQAASVSPQIVGTFVDVIA